MDSSNYTTIDNTSTVSHLATECLAASTRGVAEHSPPKEYLSPNEIPLVMRNTFRTAPRRPSKHAYRSRARTASARAGGNTAEVQGADREDAEPTDRPCGVASTIGVPLIQRDETYGVVDSGERADFKGPVVLGQAQFLDDVTEERRFSFLELTAFKEHLVLNDFCPEADVFAA